MIRPLRTRHRAMFCALGVLLPVAYLVGLAARQPVPVVASVRAELGAAARDFGKVVLTKADIWPTQRIITRLRRTEAGAVSVEFAYRDLTRPDVLVYWAAGKAGSSEGLPDNARLLGALADRAPLPVPAGLRGETGRFVLYSLADHEVIAESNGFIIQRD